ncbi:ubiquitin fusion degradation protein 1 [Nematocida major]|uniref:ubiquitin fusion degradation protein 1 n=1 Tax=Nematocida major TaxID=1912982 RepID=UPI002007DD1A|nr:ubiquitin fusion degradation protein 1 [Nematocida major]KAH9386619.1 ubiquitin fusion degradation protein 1 [Nematocida major]
MFNRGASAEKDLEWILFPERHSPEKVDCHHTGKVFLPQMCLIDLDIKKVETPYIFRISAHKDTVYTHVGVHEFIEPSDRVQMPNWLYDQLALDGSSVRVRSVSLPKGNFIKLLPQSRDFLDIENPKAALENSLRNYQVLSQGDTISLYMESEFKNILFTVAEINPKGEGISIVDVDLEVDFLPPVDYTESVADQGDSLVQIAPDGSATIQDPSSPNSTNVFGVIFMKSEQHS